MTDPESDNPILVELFRHNLWANLTLINLCLTLPEKILETNVPGTYGGIRETLTHVVGAEVRYLLALAGGLKQPQPSLEETAPDLASVREHARQSGERFIAYAGMVEGNPILDVIWHGQTYKMPAAFYLVQALNHSTEHRSQVKIALTHAGISPPELDGWTWDDERREQTQ